MANDGISVPYNRDLKPLEELLSSVRRPGDFCVQGSLETPMPRVEVEGAGRAIAPELRDIAFTAAGQLKLKERSDGRYGRSLGLFAAGLLAQAMGARLEAGGTDGAAIIRVVLPAA